MYWYRISYFIKFFDNLWCQFWISYWKLHRLFLFICFQVQFTWLNYDVYRLIPLVCHVYLTYLHVDLIFIACLTFECKHFWYMMFSSMYRVHMMYDFHSAVDLYNLLCIIHCKLVYIIDAYVHRIDCEILQSLYWLCDQIGDMYIIIYIGLHNLLFCL